MDEAFYRTYQADVQIRSVAKGGTSDGRTVYGAAVPFDLPMQIDDDLTEEWARESFNHQMDAIHRVPLYHLHKPHGGKHVGHLMMARADPKHLYVEGHVSKTRDGDDYLEMVKDESLPDFSIGFIRARSMRRGNVIRRTRADLIEVAGVPEGAFGQASAIAGVRSAEHGGVDMCPTCGHVSGAQSRSRDVDMILANLPILPPLA